MTTSQDTINDENIIRILTLLRETYNSTGTEKVKLAEKNLEKYSENFKNYTETLFKCLLLKTINNEEIPLDLHQSLANNLRHTLLKNYKNRKSEEIILCIKNKA